MTIFIKNMVCIRCKMIVKQELANMGIFPVSVELGEVEVLGNLSTEKLGILKLRLAFFDLEILGNRKSILIEKIKKIVQEIIHSNDDPLNINFSLFLSNKLKLNYTYMANLFSKTEGTTIENYMIVSKIQFVKELIQYNELSLTQISYKLNYSSVSHLSNQFKKITGSSPSFFKSSKELRYDKYHVNR